MPHYAFIVKAAGSLTAILVMLYTYYTHATGV